VRLLGSLWCLYDGQQALMYVMASDGCLGLCPYHFRCCRIKVAGDCDAGMVKAVTLNGEKLSCCVYESHLGSGAGEVLERFEAQLSSLVTHTTHGVGLAQREFQPTG
jgi:hypothetical protein